MPMPMQVAGRPPKVDRGALARKIETAMAAAASLAMENGVTDQGEIRDAMLEARDGVLAREG